MLRVCTVLLKWVDENFYDFVEDTELTARLLSFIEGELATTPRFTALAKKLKDLIKKKVYPESRPISLAGAPSNELFLLFLHSILLFIHHVTITVLNTWEFVSDFNEITPSKLLRNNIKVKEKFCVVLVHFNNHNSAHLFTELG
jgi:hypothetical protein